MHTRAPLVFAYGSNLDSARLTARVGPVDVVGVSTLPAHVLRFHKRGSTDGTAKANALWTGVPTDVVHGVVYRIAPGRLDDLDRIEGVGSGYDRRELLFELTNGSQTVRASIYLAQPQAIDDDLRPARWYLDHVIRGAVEHALPPDLVRELERSRRCERGRRHGRSRCSAPRWRPDEGGRPRPRRDDR